MGQTQIAEQAKASRAYWIEWIAQAYRKADAKDGA